MISNTVKNLLLLIIFLSDISFQATMSCSITHKYEVQVVNKLPPRDNSLYLHCASGNNEVGRRTIYAGQKFGWKFCENFMSNTLFFCHLWWGSKNRAFNVFKSNHRNDCNKYVCIWSARSDGIYYQNGYDGKFVKKYDWK
ncbi:hypothetical protein ABFS82_03G049900 [Erythranthe guttata]